ncbi:hypothetical protein [Aporhodopirellula aestuarii]|nr:hypothetical protein [Aporhodopirellula aestuarii]
MKRFMCFLCLGMAMCSALPGCGDSSPQNAYDGASEQEIADFKAQYAKDQARQEAEAKAMAGK